LKAKKVGIFLIVVLCTIFLAYYAVDYIDIPQKFGLQQNSSDITASDSGVLKNGIYKSGNQNQADFIKEDNSSSSELNNLNLNNKKVVALGNSIGVKIYTDGCMVVEISEVECENGKKISPAKKCGISGGDIIKKYNGEKITDINSLKKQVEKCGEREVKIVYLRNGKQKEAFIKPVKASDGGMLKLGMWVKDSSAGIGTMTFFDPQSKSFAALGHGISADNGKILSVLKGSVVKASILDVKKGKSGDPGELCGIFLGGNSKIGSVNKNIKYGIYGKVENQNNIPKGKEVYIGRANTIKIGRASILSNVAGEEVCEYEIEIQKVMLYNEKSTKGMVIKVTDKNLIELTGGIVQGMSGSPIIQNDKLIGAVTHVFVNDPTRGYGIFIENMLAEAEKIK